MSGDLFGDMGIKPEPKTVNKYSLIASAPNDEQLKIVIAKYFYCDKSKIVLNGNKVFINGKQKNVVIRKFRGRYRLEHRE